MEIIKHQELQFYKWTIGASTFLIWPEIGARLMHWYITMADGSTRDVIHWPANPDYTQPRKIRGGNPILFPFPARTYDQGKENFWSFNKEQRPMPRHGFAVDGAFKIIDIHPRGFSAQLQPNTQDYQAYPFQYAFTVKYYLSELSLAVDLVLKNEDTKPIPWAGGHHFYFQLPWHDHLTRKNYQINIPTKKAFIRHQDGSLLPTECTMPTTLDNPLLLDRMHTKIKGHTLEWSTLSQEEKMTMKLTGNPTPSEWTTVTTWTENEHSPFFCIEPWLAPANAWEHKKGLCWVEPGQTQTFTVSIDL